MEKFHRHFEIGKSDQGKSIVDFLVDKGEISKEKIKQVLNFGGVWLSLAKHPNRPRKRLRRAKKELFAGEIIDFYFDEKILQMMKESSKRIVSDDPLQTPHIIKDGNEFSCWYKPALTLSQGTDYGDEGSMLRVVEKAKGKAFLIHRLDREVAGVMVFAHTQKMAALLSTIFQKRMVKKEYVAFVSKIFTKEDIGRDFKIIHSLDGKSAETHYQPILIKENGTYLHVDLSTGRKHQIRRHLAMEGFPIVGDLRYGPSSTSETEIKLWAVGLEFPHPTDNKKTVTSKMDLPRELF